MKTVSSKAGWLMAALLVLVGLVVAGCATTESENASTRPWNSPQTWETGNLPSSMNEGH